MVLLASSGVFQCRALAPSPLQVLLTIRCCSMFSWTYCFYFSVCFGKTKKNSYFLHSYTSWKINCLLFKRKKLYKRNFGMTKGNAFVRELFNEWTCTLHVRLKSFNASILQSWKYFYYCAEQTFFYRCNNISYESINF